MNDSSWSGGTPQPPAEPAPVRIPMAIPLYKPQWSYVILGAIVLVSLLVEVLGLEALFIYGAKINEAIAVGEWWRLLTATFLHGGVLHLFFNVYALFQLGPETERLFNRNRFLVIYFLSGLYASLASYAFTLAPSVGASGAIFGLVGALIAYMRQYRQFFGRSGQQYLLNMLVIVGINFVLGFVQPGIDNWAHLGGLVTGFIVGTLLLPRYALPQSYDSPVMRDVSSPTRVWLVAAVGLVGVVVGVMLVTFVRGVGFWILDFGFWIGWNGLLAADLGSGLNGLGSREYGVGSRGERIRNGFGTDLERIRNGWERIWGMGVRGQGPGVGGWGDGRW